MTAAPARVSVKEVRTGTAARILRVSQKTIARLCEEGTLRARRVTGQGWWLIDYDSLVLYAARIRNS